MLYSYNKLPFIDLFDDFLKIFMDGTLVLNSCQFCPLMTKIQKIVRN